MRYAFAFLALVFALVGHAQQEPLRVVQSIALPGVGGRFDRLAVDLKGNRLFLGARANKTIEVLDLATGKRIHSISGIGTPHAEYYVPAPTSFLSALATTVRANSCVATRLGSSRALRSQSVRTR